MINERVQSQALLIHHDSVTRMVDVTSHAVLKSDAGYTLGAGIVFSEADKQSLIDILLDDQDTNVPNSFIDESILYSSKDRIVWYKPAGYYDIVFRCDSGVIKRGKAHYPSHVFMFTGSSLHAFAYKGSKRPTIETPLYLSPTSNVYQDGHICLGSANFSRVISESNIKDWESFFFEGIGTHLGTKVIRGYNDWEKHNQFWVGLIDSQSKFPARKLIPYSKDAHFLVR